MPKNIAILNRVNVFSQLSTLFVALFVARVNHIMKCLVDFSKGPPTQ